MQDDTLSALAFLPKGFRLEDLDIKPFKPCCFYLEPMDWFFYYATDCATVECLSKDQNICILTDFDGKFIGMQLMWFSDLPDYLRAKFKEATGVEPEDVIEGRATVLASAIAESRLYKDLRLKKREG